MIRIVGTTLFLSVKALYHLFNWIENHSSWPASVFMSYFELFRKLKEAEFPLWKSPRVWQDGEVLFGLEAENLDVNILITAYSATLDATTIRTSISACNSDEAGLEFWRNYIHRLEATIVNRSGQWESLPKRVHDVFRKAVHHMVQSPDVARGNLQEINSKDRISAILVLGL